MRHRALNEYKDNRGENSMGSKGERYIEVASCGTEALMKVIGLGDMHLAPTMDDLSVMLVREGSKHLAIDLTGCAGMDSTFMGTLISISVRFSEVDGWMCLINVPPECQSLLKMLGVWGMVPVRESFEIEPVKTARIKPPQSAISSEKRMNVVKLAHQRLVEISEDNRERFGPFLQSLKDDIDGEMSED